MAHHNRLCRFLALVLSILMVLSVPLNAAAMDTKTVAAPSAETQAEGDTYTITYTGSMKKSDVFKQVAAALADKTDGSVKYKIDGEEFTNLTLTGTFEKVGTFDLLRATKKSGLFAGYNDYELYGQVEFINLELLKEDSSIVTAEAPVITVYEDMTVSNEEMWNAVVVSTVPELTVSDVTIEYLAGSAVIGGEQWKPLSYQKGALDLTLHNFGTQETEKVRISYAGSETYQSASVVVEVSVQVIHHYAVNVSVVGAAASLVSVDKAKLYVGETATVTITPVEGYHYTVTVNGEAVEPENDQVVVTMGSEPVNVVVTYAWANVTVEPSAYGTVNVGAPDENGVMTVIVTPNTECGVVSVTVNGETYTELTYGKNGVVTLEVPVAAENGMNTVSAVILPELDTPAEAEQPVDVNYFEGFELEGTLEEYLFEAVVNEENSILTAEDVTITYQYVLPINSPLLQDLKLNLPLDASFDSVRTYAHQMLETLKLDTLLGSVLDGILDKGADALNFHEFGTQEYETLHFEYKPGSDASQCAYKIDRLVAIHLVDNRIPTELVLSKTTYTMTYGSETAVDGVKALVTAVVAEDGTHVAFTADQLTLGTDITKLDVGEYEITVRYRGNNNYAASEAVVSLIVKKAPVKITIQSAVEQYNGQPHEVSIVTDPAGVKYASIVVGVDGSAKGYVSIMLDSKLKETLDKDITIPVIGTVLNPYQELLKIVNQVLNSDTPEQAQELLTTALENLQKILDSMNMDVDVTGMVQVLNFVLDLKQRLDIVDFYLDQWPTDVGVYVIGAATIDSNYELALNVGYLVITPVVDAKIVWNQEIENHIIPYADAQTFDFGAALVKDEQPVSEANLKYLFVGIDMNGQFTFSQEEASRTAGAYTELCYNFGNYLAVAGRHYLITRDDAQIRFLATDEEGNTILADYMETGYVYDGQPHGVDAVLVDKDGNVIEGHTPVVTYIGISAGLEGYASTERPTNVGVYLVVASLVGDSEYHMVVSANARMTIEPKCASLKLGEIVTTYGEPVDLTQIPYEAENLTEEEIAAILATLTCAAEDEVGTHCVTANVPEEISKNVCIIVCPGKHTVLPAEPDLGSIVVKADDIARCVYAPDPELTWSLVSGQIPEGLDLQITLTREPGTALGEYVISGTSALENVTVLDGTFTITLCDACEFCPSKQYEDLDTDQWYHTATDFVLEHGIMHGFDTGVFQPYGTLTRAQWALMMYQMAGKPACDAANPYADVVEGAWYYDAVVWANATGVIIGYTDGNYGVNDYLTREQMITILYRYAGKPATTITENTYADADTISFWAADAMLWAEEIHLINGSGDNLCRAIEPCSRVEAAQVLMNYILRVLA